jgi:hypothetical protein
MVDCPSGKILNPETNLFVNIDGKIGMELAAKKETMYQKASLEVSPRNVHQ